MSEMVERVAKTMRDGMPLEPTWEDWLEQARDAIKDMRKPNKAMLEALNECGGDTEAIWPAMIDAALRDE